MSKIIGIGNALLDIIVPIESDDVLDKTALPKGSMQLITNDKRLYLQEILAGLPSTEAAGGSASNAMQALSRLGGQAGFIGTVGADSYGEIFQSHCKKAGLEVRILQADAPTGIATTLVSPDGERTFGTFLGAASMLDAETLDASYFRGYDYLFIEGYLVQNYDLIERVIQRAREVGLQIVLDLASYNVVCEHFDFFRYLVDKYVDIVFANEDEAAAFTLSSDPYEALELLSQHCKLAIVKMGADGAVAQYHEGVPVFAEAMKGCRVVDTTGAGDFFAGGFLYAFSRGFELKQCLQVGALLGGTVVQTFGASLPEETWHEIRLKMNEILTWQL